MPGGKTYQRSNTAGMGVEEDSRSLTQVIFVRLFVKKNTRKQEKKPTVQSTWRKKWLKKLHKRMDELKEL
jgi:hypothetical protein